ncbi:MAG: hypothetical protein LWW78_07955 [Deltaproteobacteria bacterium]|nr:hypothetical protein [Deltaproteobacteria bacterium]
MIPPFLIAFDIETIPDEKLAISVLGEEGDTLDEVLERQRKRYGKERVEDVFLSPPFHKIISLSMFLRFLRPDNTVERVWMAMTPNLPEEEILKRFWKIIGNIVQKAKVYSKDNPVPEHPYIITYNGKNFDIPVLIARTLKHREFIVRQKFENGAVASGLSTFFDDEDRWEREKANYTYRHSRYNIDLLGILGGYRQSLYTICSLCNIPVKTEGRGNEVVSYYKNREFEKIARYCAEDIKATYLLYLNRLLLKADIQEIKEIQEEIEMTNNLPLKIIG